MVGNEDIEVSSTHSDGPQNHRHNLPSSHENKAQASSNGPKNEEAFESNALQHLNKQLLQFLSNASNETLVGCLVGLGAATYLVLGRLGLILIGVVCGILLNATWGTSLQGHEDEGKILPTVSIAKGKDYNVIERLLNWRENKRELEVDHTNAEKLSVTEKDLEQKGLVTLKPATSAALEGLADAVIRDYVRYWYEPLLPSEISFPFSCRQILTKFIFSLSLHLSRRRVADTFLDFLTNSSSIFIVFLNELSSALVPGTGLSVNLSSAIYKYLETNPDSNLANVLDIEQQKNKLLTATDDILHGFLDSNAYRCEPVRIFLRELLAGLVLESTVQTCSRSHFLNGWIVYLLEKSESGLLDAIDVGVGESTSIDGEPLISPTGANGSLSNIEPSNNLNKSSKTFPNQRRTITKAENAMEVAMQEAKRLSELIAIEDAKKGQEANGFTASSTTHEDELTQACSQRDMSVTQSANSPRPSSDSTESSRQWASDEMPSNFTKFDQLLSPGQLLGHSDGPDQLVKSIPALTLANAVVMIIDDFQPREKTSMRSKPTIEYLLQVEPASSQHPGWMIARKYGDFETVHEVLRRISVVSGVPIFAQKHSTIPAWKNKTRASLCADLERYLRDALSFPRLAESEGMKRFLEKDRGLDRSLPVAQKGGFGFPSPAAFETMGKGMLDVLASAPKGAAGGGKALLGGVTGVLGGVGSLGQRKQAQSPKPFVSKVDASGSPTKAPYASRASEEQEVRSHTSSVEPNSPAVLENRPSLNWSDSATEDHGVLGQIEGQQPLPTKVQESNRFESMTHQSSLEKENLDSELNLPPPPSEIKDDYQVDENLRRAPLSVDDRVQETPFSAAEPAQIPKNPPALPKREIFLPLTEPETQVAVELFFAVINQLYTLSSAWNIRRTILNAAKTFLLRPGNPNLEAIRLLLQETVIDANISDAGLAAHLTRLRQNVFPTSEERQNWPPPPTPEEQEKLRVKARKLLIENGMPQALTSVMGAAASGEALGRLFDCLQVEEVARGLVFAILLQGIRAVTQ